jgi:hypothetical protein
MLCRSVRRGAAAVGRCDRVLEEIRAWKTGSPAPLPGSPWPQGGPDECGSPLPRNIPPLGRPPLGRPPRGVSPFAAGPGARLRAERPSGRRTEWAASLLRRGSETVQSVHHTVLTLVTFTNAHVFVYLSSPLSSNDLPLVLVTFLRSARRGWWGSVMVLSSAGCGWAGVGEAEVGVAGGAFDQ